MRGAARPLGERACQWPRRPGAGWGPRPSRQPIRWRVSRRRGEQRAERRLREAMSASHGARSRAATASSASIDAGASRRTGRCAVCEPATRPAAKRDTRRRASRRVIVHHRERQHRRREARPAQRLGVRGLDPCQHHSRRERTDRAQATRRAATAARKRQHEAQLVKCPFAPVRARPAARVSAAKAASASRGEQQRESQAPVASGDGLARAPATPAAGRRRDRERAQQRSGHDQRRGRWRAAGGCAAAVAKPASSVSFWKPMPISDSSDPAAEHRAERQAHTRVRGGASVPAAPGSQMCVGSARTSEASPRGARRVVLEERQHLGPVALAPGLGVETQQQRLPLAC